MRMYRRLERFSYRWLCISSTYYIQLNWFCRVFDSMRLTWVGIWNLIFDLRWCVMLATGCVWLKSTEVANDDERRIKILYNLSVLQSKVNIHIECDIWHILYIIIYISCLSLTLSNLVAIAKNYVIFF